MAKSVPLQFDACYRPPTKDFYVEMKYGPHRFIEIMSLERYKWFLSEIDDDRLIIGGDIVAIEGSERIKTVVFRYFRDVWASFILWKKKQKQK